MSATLASLRIRNLALVEDLLWEPPPGCVAVTGETGAGKSVILGAVKLLVGERADKSLIRAGADSCTVEGVFELSADSPALAAVEEGGAEPCEEGRLIIRRTVTLAGSGKQFVNGSPCTIGLLRLLGDLLVDLHGPHDHQSLFSTDQQLRLLDAFAGAGGLREEFLAARKKWGDLVGERKRVVEGAEALAREIDLLSHQTSEIGEAALQPGEEEPLVSRLKTASNARRLVELCAGLKALLDGDESSMGSALAEAGRLAREMGRLDPGSAEIAQGILSLQETIRDLSRAVDCYSDSLECDPARLAEIEARLDRIQSLKRKYGTTVEEVIAFGESATARLESLRLTSGRRDGLDAEISSAHASMQAAAADLTKARRKAVPELTAGVRSHLADLGFARSGFTIALRDLAEPGPGGSEEVEFLFAPNPGEPERPLRAIASSGEISRVMLALKTALVAQDDVSILIFDEIDANVGGEIGAKVGAKMRELGACHQVFCITHLPQVASAASAHFVVTKDTTGERTRTSLVEASGSAREEEIARMLGGRADSALTHARTLLGQNGKPAKGRR